MNPDTEKITVVIVKPGKAPTVNEIETGLQSYQSIVGGYIEEVTIDENTILICNEEGKLKGLAPNRIVNEDMICGTFFLAGYDGGEELVSLTEEQQKCYSEAFYGLVADLPGETRCKTDLFTCNVNKYLSGNNFDLKKLSESYETDDKQYAKNVLRELHGIFVKSYGTDCIDELDEYEDEFILVPAVLRSEDTGKICIGFVYLDTSSSGEHWDTIFITEKGVHSQKDIFEKKELQELRFFLPYRYWYTPEYKGDIHSEIHKAPYEVKEMINYATVEQTQYNDMQMG